MEENKVPIPGSYGGLSIRYTTSSQGLNELERKGYQERRRERRMERGETRRGGSPLNHFYFLISSV